MIKLFILLALSVSLFCSCTTNVAGTISETDTGCSIAGTVSDTSGKIVSNAIVIIHKLHSSSSSSGSEFRTVHSWQLADTTFTNINGSFLFDSVDTGNFLIEVIHSDSLCAATPVTVTYSDSLIQTKSVVKLNGVIIGKIDSSFDGSKGNVAVLIKELGRISQVNDSGAFNFKKVPEWQYHLTIVRDTLTDTSAGTTALVPVTSGIISRVNGLGSPYGITIEKDAVQFSNLYFNTDSGSGGCIAFLENNSVIKLRLLIGLKNFYHQVDVYIDKYSTGNGVESTSNTIPFLIDANSEISTYNDSTLLSKFSIVKKYSSIVYNVNTDTSHISGTILIAGIPENSSYLPVKISGSFSTDIGTESKGSWDCDFGDTICSCWFLYR